MSVMSYKKLFSTLCLTLPLVSGCTPWKIQQAPLEALPTLAEVQPQNGKLTTTHPNLGREVEPTPLVVSGNVGLQLGAFKNPHGAAQTVKRLQQSYPLVFEHRSPIIRAIDRDGTTLYRVIIGPYLEADIAASYCTLMQQGGEVCFPTEFDRVDLRVDLEAKTKEE